MLFVRIALITGHTNYFPLNYRLKKILTYYINMLITNPNIEYKVEDVEEDVEEEYYSGSDDDDEYVEDDYDSDDGFVVKG